MTYISIDIQWKGAGCINLVANFYLSVFAHDHNRPQTTVYITIWSVHGLYPLENWSTKFYQEKDYKMHARTLSYLSWIVYAGILVEHAGKC